MPAYNRTEPSLYSKKMSDKDFDGACMHKIDLKGIKI
jgi:hypothetical protein